MNHYCKSTTDRLGKGQVFILKRTVWIWQLVGFAVTALGGTLLHFLYDFTSKATWAAIFSSVNESTWEHMKLLFWPMFIFAIIQSFFFKSYENFWCAKLWGIISGLVAIPILFYTYNGIIGKSPAPINIAIFFVSAVIAYVYEARMLNAQSKRCKSSKTALAIICTIALLFVIFTFKTPEIGIFKDPLM